MIKHFHAHLIGAEELEIQLELLDLSIDEKNHLLALAHTSFYHVALDTVLSELPQEHKKTFLENLAVKSHDEIWLHLKSNIQDVEEKVRKAIDATKQAFMDDLKEAKEKKLAS